MALFQRCRPQLSEGIKMADPIDKIRAYLKRARKLNLNYPLEKKGIFHVLGVYDGRGRKEIGTYEGRFIDVVAYATQRKGFYRHNIDNPYHISSLNSADNGWIRKVKVKKLNVLNKNLADIVRKK